MSTLNTTQPPRQSERRSVEAFEAAIKACGEAQARLRNIQVENERKRS